MRYQLRDDVFLEWAFFYIASDNLDMNGEVDWSANYSLFDRELWIPLESNSDGTDEDNLKLTVMSDSIALSEVGSYELEAQEGDLIFEGSISTPDGTFYYMESADDLINGTKHIALKIYRSGEKELTVIAEAIGQKLMSDHIAYFGNHPVISNDQISNEDWPEVEFHLDAITTEDSITEEEARTLFEALSDDLYGGTTTAVNHVLRRSSSYNQPWVFSDTRDESENIDTAFVISEFKFAAFEEDGLPMPIAPLPTYPIQPYALRWMRDALQVDLTSLQLQKWFVYAVREGFRYGLSNLSDDELEVVRAVGQRLRELCFEAPRLEELRLEGIESTEETLNATI